MPNDLLSSLLGFVPSLLTTVAKSRFGVRLRNAFGRHVPPSEEFGGIYEQAILEYFMLPQSQDLEYKRI